jgi:hypothetical protein
MNCAAPNCFWSIRLDKINDLYMRNGGPGSVVGIATAYELEIRGSNAGGGEIFRTCPDRLWGPSSLLYRVFPGGKVRPVREADPSLPSSAEVKNRVEPYLYSP